MRTGITLALGFMAGCWILGHSLLAFKGLDRSVSVKGLAEREVPADLAIWPISFRVTAKNLSELNARMDKSRATIMQFLHKEGLSEAEILTATPRVQENEQTGPNRPDWRYRIQAVITVRSKEINKIKKGMADARALVSQGVILVRSYEFTPSFVFTGLNKIKPEMIAEATGNARKAAEQFAKDSGAHVGAILQANQGYFTLSDRDAYTPEIKKIRVVTSVKYQITD